MCRRITSADGANGEELRGLSRSVRNSADSGSSETLAAAAVTGQEPRSHDGDSADRSWPTFHTSQACGRSRVEGSKRLVRGSHQSHRLREAESHQGVEERLRRILELDRDTQRGSIAAEGDE